MNRWVKAVFALSLLSVLTLTAVWHQYVYAPMQTQTEFMALMDDAAPLLKKQKKMQRAIVATSISALLDTPQANETAEKKAERLAAKKKIEASVKDAAADARDLEFDVYKTNLQNLDPRFAALNHNHLAPCQNEDAYRNWGALRLWQAWAEKRESYDSASDSPITNFESNAAQYTGRPVSFEEIKSVGEAEYAAVQSELKTLAAQVQADFGQGLDSFAARPENFSTSGEDITNRLSPLLAEVEAKFQASGDFDFAPVPAANVQTREGYGPNFAIASYNKRKNSMIIYWADGRYNHVYDTMLVVHEIMPGHHLQLAMEKKRSCGQGPISAPISFLEGWATYAERLADERGLFDAPDQRLGWLDYRLVRAMRIIIDTARIENGLTEQQAWDLWQEKMPPRLNDDFPREWARINKSPHYLSYIFGSQVILEARETLRKKLGTEFDEADFHAALLNAHHQSLMFFPHRIEAQMRARRLLGNTAPNAAETTL